MPNGKPGDHPYTDIVIHGRDIYSGNASKLVREIAEIASDSDRRKLAELLYSQYNEYANPDVEKLERVLTEMRDTLLGDARDRGFEA